MQLKSLELFGFKSFADKTKLHFDKGITGIVGPNGCGKSNVIDAIRWVLGEQSTKNLRSDKMEEVIFNGNEKRKRSNLAEVSITFENTKNLLPTEFSSVTITRKLFREGGSEYFLNNVPCRLKDIETLLLDTGIGPDSYAIIELKMVDELLNDKNNTRRELFDEAAGISKYKIRKKETLKRLETTEQDLVRVEDILQEIEKNLKNLEKQAKKAEKFLELKKNYKFVSSQYVYLKSFAIKNQEKETQVQQSQFQDQILEIKTQMLQYEAMLQELQKELLLQEELLVSKQKKLNQISEEIQNQEAEKKLLKEKNKFLNEKMETLKTSIVKEGMNKLLIENDLQKLENELDNYNENYDKLEYFLQELEENLEYDKNQVKIRKIQLDETTEKIQKKQSYLNQIEKNLSIQKIKLEALDKQLQQNIEEKDYKNSGLLEFSEQLEKEKTAIQALENSLTELQKAFTENKNKEQQLLELQEAQKKQIQETQLLIEKKKNEYQLIKSLVDNLEGYSESIKYLIKKKDWANQPVLLSDIFGCPEPYKIALELFLEPYLNYFVVHNYEEAFHAIHLLTDKKLGKAQFFILEEIEKYLKLYPQSHIQTEHQKVLEVLQFDSQYKALAEFLFHNVYFVDNKVDIKNLNSFAYYIEKNGSWMYGRTQMIGGSIGLFEGKKIGRKKDLEILQDTIKENENRRLLLQQNLESTQKQLASLPLKSLENQIKEKNQELLKAQKNYSILEFKQKEFQESIQKADLQKSELEKEFQKLKAEVFKNTQSYETIQEELAILQEEFENQNKQYQVIYERFNALQNQYNKTNLEFLEVKNKIQSIRQEIKFRRENYEKIDKNLTEWSTELEALQSELDALASQLTEDNDDLVELYEKKDFAKKHLAEQEENVRTIKNAIQRYENQIKELRNKKESLEKEIEHLKEVLTEIKIQWNAISERFQVEFNIAPEDLKLEDLFENVDDLPSEEAVYQQVIDLRNKIHQFGGGQYNGSRSV
ncbi:MAG: chromosome partition protein Smc [Bacteroidia bacterium]|nr:MAG: chromosome partition protein Smc [Bacteroidia bacterium]